MSINEINSNPHIQVVLKITELKELFLLWQEESKQSMTGKDDEEYLTPDDVSFRYKVSKVTLWRNSKSGLWPPPIKVGRKSLYRKSDMDNVFKPKKA